MTNEFISAKTLLERKGISLLDAARLICNALDYLPRNSTLTPIQFCSKIIEAGQRHVRIAEMSLAEGFALYLKSKQHLRKDSFNDIRYLGNRLSRAKPELVERNFSELTVAECEEWLNAAFHTNPQFNKARTMLHGLFEFALRREWCDKNPIKRIERKKVVEKEIQPLKLAETKRLIKTAQNESPEYAVVAALLVYTGIRPREVRRLTWRDIDTEEKTITVRSQCSKTGGVRQVEIPPVLNRLLITHSRELKEEKICPTDWQRRWRKIRDNSGFRGRWVQDVLRHTYASFHAKNYADLPRLQLNMGHRDLSLLRSRYVNMRQDVDYVKRTINSAVNVALVDANGNAVNVKVLQSATGDSLMTEIYYFDPHSNMMSVSKVFSNRTDQSVTTWQPTQIEFVLPNGTSQTITIFADESTRQALGTVFRSEPCEVCDGGKSTTKFFLMDGGTVNPEGN